MEDPRAHLRIAALALAVAAAATGLACGGAGTPDGPTRPPVIIKTTATDLGSGTPGAPCATNRQGKTFIKDGVTYTCGGNRPYHWMAPTKAPTSAPTEAAKPRSASQQNADRMAASYLENQSFSRKGLIDQLTYEGFTKKEATSAVDQVHADWNAQAVGCAKSYLDSQAFSKKSLTEQLEYDGFTPAQAKYGVSKSGL